MDDARPHQDDSLEGKRVGWWKCPKFITEEQVLQAIRMRDLGLTNREISRRLGIPKTTLWENVYASGKKARYERVPTFRNTPSVRVDVQRCKRMGYNSIETSIELNIPLKDVNWIWIRVRDN